MIFSLVVIVFLISMLGAWYLGYRFQPAQPFKEQKCNLPQDYLIGLNYLLNEEPDKAVDIFIKMLEVDSNTVETHLAVGKLFRRRGEVDRAIRIHQNLIARPLLDKTYREQSLFELGQDYLSAGVLDRAERVFLEVLNVKEYSIPALRALLDIYQQEKEWENAINIAKKLQIATTNPMSHVIAHYYCELANASYLKKEKPKGDRYLKLALDTDEKCVRASLLKAQTEIERGDFKEALRHLQRIQHQNPEYISEAVNGLVTCYSALNEDEKIMRYIIQLIETYPHVPMVFILIERFQRFKDQATTTNYMTDYVKRYPSMHGLHLYIKFYLSKLDGAIRDDLAILQQLTSKLLMEQPDYQCISCGFTGKSLHWQCPGCKQWNSTKPLHIIEALPA